MKDPLMDRVAELGPFIAALKTPGAGLVPGCVGVGHRAGRWPVGYMLDEQEEGMAEEYEVEASQFLIWSLGQKKWMAPGYSGYVDRDQVARAGRFEWSDVQRCCSRETSPMASWRPTLIWPRGSRVLPAVPVAEGEVLEAGTPEELDKVINAAARLRIAGWDAYWEEVGEVYQTTLTRPAEARGRGFQTWAA